MAKREVNMSKKRYFTDTRWEKFFKASLGAIPRPPIEREVYGYNA